MVRPVDEDAPGIVTPDAGCAADLDYRDQAHLTRDFSANFGMPPGRYVRANQG
jgi:hypothetical protein